MLKSTLILMTGAALSVAPLTFAATAFAATPKVAPPAAATANANAFSGPAINGVCLLSREAVVANAKVGLVATARLKTLADGVNDELTPERNALQAEAKAIEDSRLTGDALKARQTALAQRVQALQAKATQRQQQLELTRQKVLATISSDAEPVIEVAYKAHGCGVLFNRDAVMAGGQSMDLTTTVVQGLDARITTISFDLEPPPAPARP